MPTTRNNQPDIPGWPIVLGCDPGFTPYESKKHSSSAITVGALGPDGIIRVIFAKDLRVNTVELTDWLVGLANQLNVMDVVIETQSTGGIAIADMLIERGCENVISEKQAGRGSKTDRIWALADAVNGGRLRLMGHPMASNKPSEGQTGRYVTAYKHQVDLEQAMRTFPASGTTDYVDALDLMFRRLMDYAPPEQRGPMTPKGPEGVLQRYRRTIFAGSQNAENDDAQEKDTALDFLNSNFPRV